MKGWDARGDAYALLETITGHKAAVLACAYCEVRSKCWSSPALSRLTSFPGMPGAPAPRDGGARLNCEGMVAAWPPCCGATC